MSTNVNNTNSYDDVPYESSPYPNTHPAHLATMGQVFGMTPTAVEKARILELGCSSGGNIIPLALQYPKAEIVGVDLSQVQISMADKVVKDLKLKNIKFHAKSITDIKDELGKFDYIIVHGILSWVPEAVQKKVFEVCNNLLTKQGIAYISYNTLPGWNMVKSVRDMLIYHTKNFDNIHDKLAQSRLLLNFMNESLGNQDTPYAKVLKQETEILAKQPDFYLMHEHLEDNNFSFYFKDVVKMANDNKLQYLGDASLASMFVGNLPKDVSEKLGQIQDLARTEQYMDFIKNRRFRMTLLCRDDIKLQRSLSPDTIRKLALSMVVSTKKKLTHADLKSDKQVTFELGANKATISSKAPAIKASFHILAEAQNKPMMFSNLIKQTLALLTKAKATFDPEQVEAIIAIETAKLMLTGYIAIYPAEIEYSQTPSAKPVALPIVQYQCSNMPTMWVTNAKHERIIISIFDKYALRYCDGKHTHEQIAEALFEHVDKDELTVSVKDKKTKDKKEVMPHLQEALAQSLQGWASAALLSK